jgi:tetratricopeptide (TPR) repeat protein
MTNDYRIDQRDQTIHGSQTNIGKADNVIIHESAQHAPPIPRQIPSPPGDFSGREAELNELVSQFDRGATIIGLRGMGGIGKTALALVLADRIKDRFPDGQLFLDMLGTSKSPLKPDDAMAHVIRSYIGAETRLPSDLNGLGGLYCTVLSGKSTLILLDNAASREQVELLLPPEGSALLITSRNKFALPGLKEKDLNVLRLEDAKKLLLEIEGRIGEHAEVLANLCGYLPLALRNAAYALKERQNIKVADYVKRLEDARKRLDLVDASFNLSYELLSPELQKLWCLLSVFPADFDLVGAAAVWEMEKDSSEDALGDLVKWSLVDFLPTTTGEEGRYRLHDLARTFADSRLGAIARSTGQQKHAEYYKNILSKVDELYVKGGKDTAIGRDLFNCEIINIKAGQKWAEDAIASKSEKMNSALQLACDYPAEGAYALEVLLNPHERIRWLETALLAAHQLENSKMEGSHFGNLGIAYCHIGKVQKAINIFQQRLSISRKIGDAFGEANAMGNIGAAYALIGETSKAIEFFEQNLFITRMNGDRRGESKSLGNLGLAYHDLGNTGQAIECLEESLEIDRKIGNRQGEGTNLGNLGLIHANMGDTQKAIEYYSQHLTITYEIGDRRGEGNSLSNLGDAYYALGNTTQAIEYYEKALVVVRDIDDRHKEENILGKLGSAYCTMGNACKAIEYYEQELVVIREIGDRQLEEDTIGTIGNAYYVLGNAHKSMKYYEQALGIAREIGDRQGEGNSLINMSLTLNKLGQRAKAIDLAKSALSIFEQIESPYAERVSKQLTDWQGDEKPR